MFTMDTLFYGVNRMRQHWQLVFYVIVVTLQTQVGSGQSLNDSVDWREYCQWETFSAECKGSSGSETGGGAGAGAGGGGAGGSGDEVLLIKHATYGRMKLGRCIKHENFGHLNCGVDVLEAVSRQCSARRKCLFAVTSLHGNHDCPMDLIAYLVVSYVCVKVTQCRPNSCNKSESLTVPPSGGYLTSPPPVSYGSARGGGGVEGSFARPPCGSPACPWRLTAEPGQHINLTVWDYTSPPEVTTPARQTSLTAGRYRDSSGSSSAGGSVCYRYATVRDVGSGGATSETRDLTFCDTDVGSARRNSFLSESHVVEISIDATMTSSLHFLIRYELSGCPTLQPPTDSKSRRDGDVMIFDCNRSQQSWRVTCSGNAWVGQIGTCNNDGSVAGSGTARNNNDQNAAEASNHNGSADSSKTSSYGVLVVVGLGIIIGVVVGFTMLLGVLCCIRRRRGRHGAIIADDAVGCGVINGGGGGGGGGPGSPCYWKSLNGLVLHEDGYTTTELPHVSQHDYGWGAPSYTVKQPPQSASSPEHMTSSFQCGTPSVAIDLQQLPPCCRAAAVAAGAGGPHHAPVNRSSAEARQREHPYELPSFDPTTTISCPVQK